MALRNEISAQIANADALPVVLNSPIVDSGNLKEKCAVFNIQNPTNLASTIRMFRLRSDSRVSELKLYCAAITGAAADIGLYRTPAEGGAVVDVDFFATAVSLATAILTGTDVTLEAAAGPAVVANRELRIWQALGLAADPNIFYDVVLTLTATATAAGAVSLICRYVGGE